jgi:UDP-N-acetylmuramoyl-L-alanyl-D-glutamate--2,6-diaminopimelate ligase
MTVRTLDEVVADAPGLRVRRRVGAGLEPVTSVTLDSRAVVAGSLFCCVRGAHRDGHQFAAAAVDAGARSLLVDHELSLPVAQVVVDDTRPAVGPLASAFHGRPSSAMTVVGITGTNGKTTTTAILAAIFEAAGTRCGVLGTLTGKFTTPEAPELQQHLARFRDEGAGAVVMEVSSHALALRRVDGTTFAAAVFTNLSRDHLDLHGTEERYFAAKARLFDPSFTDLAVVNLDDPHGRLLADVHTVRTIGYSLDDARDVAVGVRGSSFTWRGRSMSVRLGGRFNVSNTLAAATVAIELGLSMDVVEKALRTLGPVPGRFEVVAIDRPYTVVVDFAHTPDGLAHVLATARESAGDGRVLVVFGCGGDRDATKRPMMGEIASRMADVVVVTSDNPRSEDPAAIISAVQTGVPPDAASRVLTEVDRRAAIAIALEQARPGDLVVVAGKGHETTQTVGDRVLPFDDRAVVRELAAAP